jgi:hypothetical protein
MSDALQLSPYLEAIACDLDAAAGRAVTRRRRRRPLRVAAVVVAALAVIGGTAVAASQLLGGPAPPPIQAALDAYYPQNGESFAPALGGAQDVAQFGDDVLYHLRARDGKAICLAITAVGSSGAGVVTGSGCIADTGDPHWPIGVAATGFRERELVYGQVNAPAGANLYAVRPGIEDVRIPLGVDGFFLWELPRQVVAADTDPPALSPSPAIGSLVLRDLAGATLSSMKLFGLLRAGPNGP